MRNLGWSEIALILIAVVLIFGASRLPQLGRAVGDTIKEFKKSIGGADDSAQKDGQSGKKS